MKVSILIPTKDRLPLLKEAVASARNQTHQDLSIIISDDGSSDGTVAWLTELAALDSRVILTPRNPYPGLFENINHLIDNQHGEAFCVLADDDRLHPEFVEQLQKSMQSWPDVVATFADFWQMDPNGEQLLDQSHIEAAHTGRAALSPGIVTDPIPVVLRNTMVVGFTLYRSSLVGRERFDVACGGAADIDFGLRLVSLGRFAYVPARLGEVRIHPLRASATRSRYMVGGLIRALAKHHFTERSSEALRVEMLQGKRASYAVQLRTADRGECLRTVFDYFKDPRAAIFSHHLPSLAASVALAFLPRSSARYLLRVAHALRTPR